eukprot:1272132-Alexandrium_andersonii.AAC.1
MASPAPQTLVRLFALPVLARAHRERGLALPAREAIPRRQGCSSLASRQHSYMFLRVRQPHGR